MQMRSFLRGIILAFRPQTLPVSIVPVGIATALAFRLGFVNWINSLCCLIGGLSIQIGTNLANDYYDYIQGIDTKERKGPVRVTQAGILSPSQVYNAFIFFFFIGGIAAILLSIQVSWWYFGLFGISVFLGITYTKKPIAFGYRGLADLPAFLFFGPIATLATYYAITSTFHPAALLLGCTQGCFSLVLLNINNLRDRHTDYAAGKITIPVRWGSQVGFYLIVVGMLLGLWLPLFLIHWIASPGKILLASLFPQVLGFYVLYLLKTALTSNSEISYQLFRKSLPLTSLTQVTQGITVSLTCLLS